MIEYFRKDPLKILYALSVLVVGTYLLAPVTNNDIWWHIVIGKWILANAQVPHTEHWNYFATGQSFTAYSWLMEIIYAYIDLNFGHWGLFSLKCFTILFLVAYSTYILIDIAKSTVIGVSLAAVFCSSLYAILLLRPQLISLILFLTTLYICHLISKNGSRTPYLVSTFIVFCLWGNTNITTILGIIVIIGWLLDLSDLEKSLKTILITLSTAIFGSLCTPYFGKEWLIFFSKIFHPVKFDDIKEFLPLHLYFPGTVINLFLLGISLYLPYLFKDRSYNIKNLLIIAFTLVGLTIAKFYPYSVCICSFYLASYLGAIRDKQIDDNIIKGIFLLEKNSIKFFSDLKSRRLIIATALVLSVVNLSSLGATLSESSPAIISQEKLVRYIARNRRNLPTPIQTTFESGGALMYMLSDKNGHIEPKYRVSIDGRTNITPKKIHDAHRSIRGLSPNYKDSLELIKPQTIMTETGSSFNEVANLLGYKKIDYNPSHKQNKVQNSKDKKLKKIENSGGTLFIKK